MSYPSELDTEDISELASYIERRYPTELLRMHDTRTIHFAYWDVSHRSVCAEFLDHIQQAGYRILYAGVATCPRTATRRAWVECQKRTLTEHEQENTAASDDITLTCEHCGQEYTIDDATTITIFGPDDARYTCHRCGHGIDGPSPLDNEG